MSNKDDATRRPAKGPRIGLAQLGPALGDHAANMEEHREAVARAVADGCDLLVFPELSLAGYRLKDSVPDVAIKRGSDTWKELEKLSEEVALVIGFVEESADHLFYNSAAYFEAGRCTAVHRKSYLPTYGMFDEQRYFARGRSIAAFDTKCGRVALLICEDMLHPSAVTIAACDGATLLIVPSASPARGVTTEGDADSNAKSWESYLQVMARSFGVWVAYCNRVGVEDGVSFWGGSTIVSPAGENVAKAAYYDDDFVSAVLSDDAVRRRRIVNPLVRDEDLDLTINEMSRIRGRAVEKTAAEAKTAPRVTDNAARDGDFDKPRAPRSRDGEGPPRRFDRDSPPPRFDRDGPSRAFDSDKPRSFDRDKPRSFDRDKPRSFDRDAPPRRFDKGAPPRSFDRDAPPRSFERDAPSRPFDRDKPRSFDRDKPRAFDRDAPPRPFDRRDEGPKRPGAGFRPKGPYEERGGGFGRPRSDEGGDKPRFGGQTRGGFSGASRDRDDAPRGRFGAPPRSGGGGGGFGPPRGGGFGPPRGSAGTGPRDRDDRGGERGSFAAKPRFGDGPSRPRERQRPEPARKPFHKGSKPFGTKPRGRKDD